LKIERHEKIFIVDIKILPPPAGDTRKGLLETSYLVFPCRDGFIICTMSKESYYFSHDYNARADYKIKRLIRDHGMMGYGIFWSIVEDLYNNANALRLDCDGIAYDLRADSEMVRSIINDYDLFVIKDGLFGSLSIGERLNERNKKSINARESAFKRWGKPEADAKAMPPHSEGNAIKERKGKERKGKDIDNTLMSDLSESDDHYTKIAYSFWVLFKGKLSQYNINSTDLSKSKAKNWIAPVRFMKEIDKRTETEFREIYTFLRDEKPRNDGFAWFKNIRSTESLRKQFEKVLTEARIEQKIKENGKLTGNKGGTNEEFLAVIGSHLTGR
jgi:hypothetical protein